MKYIKNCELQDKAIVGALRTAADDYENGDIVDARDRLLEVIAAIDEWMEDN